MVLCCSSPLMRRLSWASNDATFVTIENAMVGPSLGRSFRRQSFAGRRARRSGPPVQPYPRSLIGGRMLVLELFCGFPLQFGQMQLAGDGFHLLFHLPAVP